MVRQKTATEGRAGVLKRVFSSPRYVLLALLAAGAYYLLFLYVMDYGGMGAPFIAVPIYLLGTLIASSVVLVSLSAYELARRLLVITASEGGTIGVCTASFGCMIAGCGCYAPLVSSLLYTLGMGAIQVSGVIALLGNYQEWLMFLLIIINLAFIYYQTGRMARSARR